MAKVISLSSQKGGVGESITTTSLGIGLARQGKKVLVIDADPQSSLTIILGFQKLDELHVTLAGIMGSIMEEKPFAPTEGIIHHAEGVDLMPACIELSGVEVSLVNTKNRDTILRQYIETVKPMYDFILTDTSPSLGMLPINALAASDSVIIPVQAEYSAAKGLELVLKTIARVRRKINPHLAIDGILIIMVEERTNDAKEVMESLKSAYGSKIKIFEHIPRSVRASETAKKGKSIYAHNPRGK